MASAMRTVSGVRTLSGVHKQVRFFVGGRVKGFRHRSEEQLRELGASLGRNLTQIMLRYGLPEPWRKRSLNMSSVSSWTDCSHRGAGAP